MRRTILIPNQLNGPWARAAAVLLAGGVIAAASSLMGPASTSATTVDQSQTTGLLNGSDVDSSLTAVRAAKWPAYLGSLTGGQHTVDVYVGRNGPLYTVKDLQGRTLAAQITSEEVYARFPDLSPRDMHAEAVTPSDAAADH